MAPGSFANQASGSPHQISRATATTAWAPPYCLPSDRRNRNSINSASLFIPSKAPTRGSCSGATAMPRRLRIGEIQRALRVQKAHSASKKSQPLAWRPFPSVYSFASEIMMGLFSAELCALCDEISFSTFDSTHLLFVAAEEGDDFSA